MPPILALMARHSLLRLGAISLILWSEACKRKTPPDTSPLPSEEPVGYSLLRYLPGIYQGPLTSTTSVGNFPFWGVDFRPLHPAQVGGRSELDSANNIHLNFFVAQYQNRRVLCFRNGGYFQGMERFHLPNCGQRGRRALLSLHRADNEGSAGLCRSGFSGARQPHSHFLHHQNGRSSSARTSYALDRP